MNDGFINEKELRNYINNNTWNEYNQNIKNLLKFSFGNNLDFSKTFEAEKCTGKAKGQVKPDLVIKHNGAKKYISIKKGGGNSVHQEKIDVFFPYIKNTFDETTLNYLKLFHYGDGTINDTGLTRYAANECQKIYSKEIAFLNIKFNTWTYLEKFLDRFLFIGNVSSTLIVDVVYHGTIDSGIWASRDEIYSYYKNHTFNSTTLHFGTLTYQVWGRNNNFKAVHSDRRYVMQIKWGSIITDLSAIRRNSK